MTWIDEEGRVHYKRTNEDDRWIASHIPQLIDELDCHIHVNIVFTVRVFMYLYKYLFKGPDHTQFRLLRNEETGVNEITDYINRRYLSTPEAAWRILNFEIVHKQPSVSCLPVHLPSQNTPQFLQGSSDVSSASLLTRYLHQPLHPTFHSLTYSQYFSSYVLYPHDTNTPLQPNEYLEQPIPHTRLNKVCRRIIGIKICRLQTLSPTLGEVFYLRCLLQRKAGYSFEDFRTIHNTLFTTYHKAAIELGLFSNQNEAYFVLEDAVFSFQTPAQIRFLFVCLIIEGYPARLYGTHSKNN